MNIFRTVDRIETPTMLPAASAVHRNRILVASGNWQQTDPFLVFVEDWYARGAFENHPHRGIETVTYMLDGTNAHYDNHGNEGTIGRGEALWLTAGRGIVHNEVPADDRPVHTLQLWVNLPSSAKLVPADFQELKGDRVAKRTFEGGEAIVFSGQSGNAVAKTRNHAKVTFIELRMEPGAAFEQELPPDYNGFVLIVEGTGTVGGQKVRDGQLAWLSHEAAASTVRVQAQSALRAFLIAGEPLREPVVARGPFVMNTQEEIDQAFAEFRAKGNNFGLDGATPQKR